MVIIAQRNGLILLVGVAIYSLIMNYLMQIIRDYKKIEQVGKRKDLSNFSLKSSIVAIH